MRKELEEITPVLLKGIDPSTGKYDQFRLYSDPELLGKICEFMQKGIEQSLEISDYDSFVGIEGPGMTIASILALKYGRPCHYSPARMFFGPAEKLVRPPDVGGKRLLLFTGQFDSGNEYLVFNYLRELGGIPKALLAVLTVNGFPPHYSEEGIEVYSLADANEIPEFASRKRELFFDESKLSHRITKWGERI